VRENLRADRLKEVPQHDQVFGDPGMLGGVIDFLRRLISSVLIRRLDDEGLWRSRVFAGEEAREPSSAKRR
jgi:hypothetical protein